MKLDRYEIAALRERIRSARKEVESIEHAIAAKMTRMARLRAEIDTINERIEYFIQASGLELSRCVKCGKPGCTEHGLTERIPDPF